MGLFSVTFKSSNLTFNSLNFKLTYEMMIAVAITVNANCHTTTLTALVPVSDVSFLGFFSISFRTSYLLFFLVLYNSTIFSLIASSYSLE